MGEVGEMRLTLMGSSDVMFEMYDADVCVLVGGSDAFDTLSSSCSLRNLCSFSFLLRLWVGEALWTTFGSLL